MKKDFVIAFMVAALLSAAAYAQSCCLGKACKDDIQNYCGNLPAGDTKEACLARNQQNLSGQCKSYMDNVKKRQGDSNTDQTGNTNVPTQQ